VKVRCVKLLDSRGNVPDRSPWLTIGQVYHVLEVVQDAYGKWSLRANGDGSNGPALFRLEQFEIVSRRVASSWIVRWNERGGFSLTTESWSQPGYWERFYDGDVDARKVFHEEVEKIIQADP